MLRLLRHILDRILIVGNLRVVDSRGREHAFGDRTGPLVAVGLSDRKLEYELALNPALKLGEAFADGRFRMESGTIYDYLALVLSQNFWDKAPFWIAPTNRLRRLSKRVQQYNPVRIAKRNAARHYDLDGRLYDLFLDTDRQYSCAYFEHQEQSLEQAQLAKKRHIAAKLKLREGHSVLDIGSGWGGLGVYLARTAPVNVTGITLSEEQFKVSQSRAGRLGLVGSLDFRLLDYRQVAGTFDRIVSVGMFEHVGVVHYPTYFAKIRDLLPDHGVALVHSIGRLDGPDVTNPFIAKHIFPGGYIPALSELIPVIERSGLLITDMEILRLHYAMTLRHWRDRFCANRAQASAVFGERFCRIWEFYLAGSEAAFRYENLMVFQIQLAKRIGTLPLTRGYMVDEERRLRDGESADARAQRLAGA